MARMNFTRMIWRKGWIHPILQNILSGKQLARQRIKKILSPPPDSSDNLCLFFCLYPSSMYGYHRLTLPSGEAQMLVVSLRAASFSKVLEAASLHEGKRRRVCCPRSCLAAASLHEGKKKGQLSVILSCSCQPTCQVTIYQQPSCPTAVSLTAGDDLPCSADQLYNWH